MSARKLSRTARWAEETAAPPSQKRLVLEPTSVNVSKNGIEFRSMDPIPTWTELTLSLEAPGHREKITCNGVVVGCTGNRHMGYVISLLFNGLTPHLERQLKQLARDSARA